MTDRQALLDRVRALEDTVLSLETKLAVRGYGFGHGYGYGDVYGYGDGSGYGYGYGYGSGRGYGIGHDTAQSRRKRS